MAASSPLSDSFNPHLLSSPIAPKTSTDIHTPVETSRLSQSSNTNTERNPGGRGSWARVGSPGGSRVLGGIQVSTTELFSKEGSEQSKCFAASVVVVCLSILYELEKLSLKLLLLLLLLLLQKKTKRRLLPNCRLDPESSNTRRNSPQKKKNKQTNKQTKLCSFYSVS
jgi:hypothetical protein